MRNFKLFLLSGLICASAAFTGCDDDEPEIVNPEEELGSVILTFTPVSGGNAVTGTALDPDGEGPEDLDVQSVITLAHSTEYVLTIDLLDLEGDNITEEIRDEREEHMFFFGFSEELFLSPDGNGNIDNREGSVDYQDLDQNNEPVGLTTGWATNSGTADGTFRIILKHQPGSKSATSTVEDGETDMDLTWTIQVQ